MVYIFYGCFPVWFIFIRGLIQHGVFLVQTITHVNHISRALIIQPWRLIYVSIKCKCWQYILFILRFIASYVLNQHKNGVQHIPHGKNTSFCNEKALHYSNPSSSTLLYLNTHHTHCYIWSLLLGSIIGQIPPKNVKYQDY